jgi:hypothetical protein
MLAEASETNMKLRQRVAQDFIKPSSGENNIIKNKDTTTCSAYFI